MLAKDCVLPPSSFKGKARPLLAVLNFPKSVSDSVMSDFVALGTVAHQAPWFMGFSRQESWSEVPLPSPGDLPDPGSHLGLLHCRQTLYHRSHQGKPETGGFAQPLLPSQAMLAVKNEETQFQSPGQEDAQEEEMAIHSRILAWRSPWTEQPVSLPSVGS